MAKVRFVVYSLEVILALLLLTTFLLPWHQEFGSGGQVLQKALDSTVRMGLNPWKANDVPLSQWWLVWIIPIVSLCVLGRAVGGLMFLGDYHYHRSRSIFGLLGMMLLTYGWFYAAYVDETLLKSGFYTALGLGILIGLIIMVELLLPERSSRQRYLDSLPPDHPTLLAAGLTLACPICGVQNRAGQRRCHECRGRLPILD